MFVMAIASISQPTYAEANNTDTIHTGDNPFTTGEDSNPDGTPTVQTIPEGDLGSNKLEKASLISTMNYPSCHEYSASIAPLLCITPGPTSGGRTSGCIHPCNKKNPCGPQCVPSYRGSFSYWEPAALIEVSQRKGYSMLLPGGVGNEIREQSAVGDTVGPRWFFDVRIWAINGDGGKARHQTAGSTLGDQSRVCGLNKNRSGGPVDAMQGYGIKLKQFSKGGASGPGGSWEAYISDDKTDWAIDQGTTPQEVSLEDLTNLENGCKNGMIDEKKCWGNVELPSGWVSHPHQAVAAITAGWRAFKTKAQGKVSPPGSQGYYKINMDYPFIKRASEHAGSMPIPGGGAGGGSKWMGSDCFKPGDPGTGEGGVAWFTNAQQKIKPEELPQRIQEMQKGDNSKIADLHSGVFIFTVWVYTKCTLFTGADGYNVQPAPGCSDQHSS